MDGLNKSRWPVMIWAIISLCIVIVGGLLFISSGFGYQDHLWSLNEALHLFIGGAIISGVGALLSFFAFIKRRNRDYFFSLSGIILGIIVIGVFLHFFVYARKAPPIHDITTDTLNPPKFSTVLTLRNRSQSHNSCTYGGRVIAKEQKQAYPYIKPLILEVSFENAFSKALFVARDMRNWKIVNSNAAAGRIEATVTVPWFGFKDDVVIRVSSVDAGCSRIDVRSESRNGSDDFGINAKRIHTYLTLVKKADVRSH